MEIPPFNAAADDLCRCEINPYISHCICNGQLGKRALAYLASWDLINFSVNQIITICCMFGSRDNEKLLPEYLPVLA